MSRSTQIDHLLTLLDLETLELNLFRGTNSPEPRPRVFGGLVAGQAMVAATRTVQELAAHSLHAYFIRSGDPNLPILYQVERIRDGRSFSTRRVTAVQRGEAIFIMSVSFHKVERGFSHQGEMPQVPPPEQCPSWQEHIKPWTDTLKPKLAEYMGRQRPIEIRPVNALSMLEPQPGGMRQQLWIRAQGELPDDPALHQAIAVYASDHNLLSAAMRPHGKVFASGDVMGASLDHAMWMHRPFRMDGWILYDQQSPASANARGLAQGHYFTQSGELVASICQEGLIRPIERRS